MPLDTLSVLAQCPPDQLKQFVDSVLPELGDVDVIKNRSGITMLPYRDSAKGTTFLLGEVLVSEAHVRLRQHDAEGYGACIGRDTVQALAVAILDAALRAGQHPARIEQFVQAQRAVLAQTEAALMAQVDATRVQMETF